MPGSMLDRVNRGFNGILYSLVGHIHSYITNSGMPGVTDAYIENVNDMYGTVRLHMQNRTGVNGMLYEQAGTVDLVDFVFKTLTQQSNIRLEARPTYLENVANNTGEWQFGPPDAPWLTLGAAQNILTTPMEFKNIPTINNAPVATQQNATAMSIVLGGM